MLSALKYVRRHSTFDDPIFPTAGTTRASLQLTRWRAPDAHSASA